MTGEEALDVLATLGWFDPNIVVLSLRFSPEQARRFNTAYLKSGATKDVEQFVLDAVENVPQAQEATP